MCFLITKMCKLANKRCPVEDNQAQLRGDSSFHAPLNYLWIEPSSRLPSSAAVILRCEMDIGECTTGTGIIFRLIKNCSSALASCPVMKNSWNGLYGPHLHLQKGIRGSCWQRPADQFEPGQIHWIWQKLCLSLPIRGFSFLFPLYCPQIWSFVPILNSSPVLFVPCAPRLWVSDNVVREKMNCKGRFGRETAKAGHVHTFQSASAQVEARAC